VRLCGKQDCTGCGACVNRCPRGAIAMHSDDEGFAYPIIDAAQCVDCGLCVKSCPVMTPCSRHQAQERVYAAWALDDVIRQSSSSGGMFSVLALEILKRGGLVNGVVFDNDFNLKHVLIETPAELPRLRGSKYVQSDIGDVYKRIETGLKGNRLVLFTGTPCQVAGLYTFLGKKYENLYTCDFVCHGVPSPSFFKTSVRNQYGWEAGEDCDFQFRDLKGWGMAPALLFADGCVRRRDVCSDYYFQAFLSGLNYRECCYKCRYASLSRVADFTIGDFWGLPFSFRFAHGMLQKGCSLFIVNSERGTRFLDTITELFFRREFPIASCRANHQLFGPSIRPVRRNSFYSEAAVSDVCAGRTTTKALVVCARKLAKKACVFLSKMYCWSIGG